MLASHGVLHRGVKALPSALLVSIVACAHIDGPQPAPTNGLELAARDILVTLAGDEHFNSVSCRELECSFVYSAMDEYGAAKIAKDAEAALAVKGFPGVKISETESFSSSLAGSIFYGLGKGLAAVVFGAIQR